MLIWSHLVHLLRIAWHLLSLYILLGWVLIHLPLTPYRHLLLTLTWERRVSRKNLRYLLGCGLLSLHGRHLTLSHLHLSLVHHWHALRWHIWLTLLHVRRYLAWHYLWRSLLHSNILWVHDLLPWLALVLILALICHSYFKLKSIF